MYKFIAILASIVMFVSPALAETFFDRPGTEWSTRGVKAVENRNPVCAIWHGSPGRNRFELLKDFADSELYAVVQNPRWNIPRSTDQNPKWVQVELKGKGGYVSLPYRMMVLNNNTIAIRAITPEFIEPFGKFATMNIRLIDHGNLSVSFELKGTWKALETMVECLKAGSQVDLYSNIPKTPKRPETAI